MECLNDVVNWTRLEWREKFEQPMMQHNTNNGCCVVYSMKNRMKYVGGVDLLKLPFSLHFFWKGFKLVETLFHGFFRIYSRYLHVPRRVTSSVERERDVCTINITDGNVQLRNIYVVSLLERQTSAHSFWKSRMKDEEKETNERERELGRGIQTEEKHSPSASVAVCLYLLTLWQRMMRGCLRRSFRENRLKSIRLLLHTIFVFGSASLMWYTLISCQIALLDFASFDSSPFSPFQRRTWGNPILPSKNIWKINHSLRDVIPLSECWEAAALCRVTGIYYFSRRRHPPPK